MQEAKYGLTLLEWLLRLVCSLLSFDLLHCFQQMLAVISQLRKLQWIKSNSKLRFAIKQKVRINLEHANMMVT